MPTQAPRDVAWPQLCSRCPEPVVSEVSEPASPHRYVVLFNPLDQERFSVVSLLVSSPRVRVLSEDGQPLAVQISAHWSSATDTVADVYQVSEGPGRGPQSSMLTRGPSPRPHSTWDTPTLLLPA